MEIFFPFVFSVQKQGFSLYFALRMSILQIHEHPATCPRSWGRDSDSSWLPEESLFKEDSHYGVWLQDSFNVTSGGMMIVPCLLYAAAPFLLLQLLAQFRLRGDPALRCPFFLPFRQKFSVAWKVPCRMVIYSVKETNVSKEKMPLLCFSKCTVPQKCLFDVFNHK